jgi:hypothetical protein
MDDEKLAAMNKIMKLLELGKDANGAYGPEQEAANTMAAKLMAKWAVDFTDLRGMDAKSNVFEKHKIDPLDCVYCDWEATLANAIGTAFDVRVINARQPVWYLNFLGTKTDLEIAIFFYRHLRRTVCRKSETEFKRKADQETYAFGMVRTIASRLTDLYKRRQEVMESDCRAMVIVKQDGLQDFVKDQFPVIRQGRSTKLKGSSAAYAQGQADGHKVGLNRPIAGNADLKPRLSRGH